MRTLEVSRRATTWLRRHLRKLRALVLALQSRQVVSIKAAAVALGTNTATATAVRVRCPKARHHQLDPEDACSRALSSRDGPSTLQQQDASRGCLFDLSVTSSESAS